VVLTESIKIIKTIKEHIHSTKIEGSTQAKAIDDQIKKVLEKEVGCILDLSTTKNIKNFKWKNKSIYRLPADISSSYLMFFLSLHQ
jgi:hypothetical protein